VRSTPLSSTLVHGPGRGAPARRTSLSSSEDDVFPVDFRKELYVLFANRENILGLLCKNNDSKCEAV
jgi:hypothetical protein